MYSDLKETILKIINAEITIEEVNKDDLIQVIIESELSIELLTEIERMDETILVSALSHQDCSVKTMKKIHSIDPRILLYFAFIQDYPLEVLKRIYLIDKYILLEIALSEDCSIITLNKINQIDEDILYLAIHQKECSEETICKIDILSDYDLGNRYKQDDKDTFFIFQNPFTDLDYKISAKNALSYPGLFDREKENWKCMMEEYKYYKEQKKTYLSKYFTVHESCGPTDEDFEYDEDYYQYLLDRQEDYWEEERELYKYYIQKSAPYSNDSIQNQDLMNKRKKEIIKSNTSTDYENIIDFLEKYTLFKRNQSDFYDVDRLIFSKKHEDCEEDRIAITSALENKYINGLFYKINEEIFKLINLLSDVERLNLYSKKDLNNVTETSFMLKNLS